MKTATRITCLFLLSVCTLCACSAQRIGSQPPALNLKRLLQAPDGQRVDWASLRGKTVILEFWATWCPHCLEEIPHLNQLAESLDRNQFIFIAIDDEEPNVIETYARRRKMAGWLAEDDDGTTVKAYNVITRPHTIVVNPTGNIAAITFPDRVTRDGLLEISQGKNRNVPVLGPPSKRPSRVVQPASTTARSLGSNAPIFELSIRPVPPTNQVFRKHSEDRTSWEYEGMTADMLWNFFFPQPRGRFTFAQPLPKGQFELLLKHPGLTSAAMLPTLQLAISSAFGVKVQQTGFARDVFVLRSTADSDTRLLPPISDDDPQNVFIKDGELTVMASTLSQLAPVLEEYLGMPVLDETGITKLIDANVELPSRDPSAVSAALRKSMGLDLVREQRDVPLYTVTTVTRQISDLSTEPHP